MSKLRIECGVSTASFEQQIINQGLTCTDMDKLAALQFHAKSVFLLRIGKIVTRSEAIKIERRIIKEVAKIVEERE